VDEVIARASRPPSRGEELVIGPGGHLSPTEDFTLSRLVLSAGEANAASTTLRSEVVFVQHGAARVCTPDADIILELGDTMTVPAGLERSYCALGAGAELIVVRGTG
jgi:mannose-6-phosphate isomerase-like protein (cupin superfamily)